MGKGYVVLKIRVSSQTAYHLDKMAAMSGCSIGRVVDKMTRGWATMMKGERYPSSGAAGAGTPSSRGRYQRKEIKYDKNGDS